MSLLTIHQSPSNDGQNVAKVSVFADAVLYQDLNGGGVSRYPSDTRLVAMSIIGQEQAIRSIAAGCSFEHEHDRPTLRIVGPNGKTVITRWSGRWKARAVRFPNGAMHLIAISPTIGDLDTSNRHVIIAPGDAPTPAGLQRAIYDRLMSSYSTPLVPVGRIGQPESEQQIGEIWCNLITKQLKMDGHLRSLRNHPDQQTKAWSMACLLDIQPEILDGLVSSLVRSGMLPLALPPTSQTESATKKQGTNSKSSRSLRAKTSA